MFGASSDVDEAGALTARLLPTEAAPRAARVARVGLGDAFSLICFGSTWVTGVLGVLLVGVALGELAVGGVVGEFPSRVFGFIIAKEHSKFGGALGVFVGEVVGLALLIAAKLYVADVLAALYRRNIARRIHADYMRGNAFYEVLLRDTAVDNPDGRITQDVLDYSVGLFGVATTVVQVPAQVGWYTWRVCGLLDWWTVLMCYGFALVSVLLSRAAAQPVAALTYRSQARNAAFRVRHVGVRERAEEIALSRGEESEERGLLRDLSSVLGVQRMLAHWAAPLNTVVTLCAYGGAVLVYGTIVLYLRRHPELVDPGALTVFASLASFYVVMLVNGFTNVSNVMRDVGKVCGCATRVAELVRVLSRHRRLVEATATGDSVRFEHVNVVRPTGDVLVRDLSFVVREGESLFVSGPSGIGKSSIFRVLGGLWPAVGGRVSVPPATAESLLVLTQSPYVPAGTQLACLAFPLELDAVPVDAIYEAAHFLMLDHVLERPPDTWQEGLSPGERQKIAIARALIHRPRFLLLDEATSAIPQALEQAVFERLRSLGIAYITIAHNPGVRGYHTHSLDVMEHGLYRFYRNDP